MATCKIGFMSSVCPTFTMREIASACSEFGFQSFEPRIDWNHAHGIEVGAPAERIRAARRMLQDAGAGLPCVATGIHTAVPRGAGRIATLDAVKRVVDLCLLAEAPAMRVFGGGAKDVDEETRVALAVDTLWEAAEAIEGSGVQLLLETHDYFKTGRLVGQVVDRVDRPEVAVLWDTMHSVVAGEPAEETLRLLRPERVKHVHTRDLRLTPRAGGGYDAEYCDDYGRGSFPLAEIHGMLAGAGFAGTVSLERIFKRDDPDHDPHAFLKAHAKGMRAIHLGGTGEEAGRRAAAP